MRSDGSYDDLEGIYAYIRVMWLLSRKGLQPPEVAEEVYADLKTLYMMLEELLVSSVKINHKSVNLLHHKNSCPCNKVTHFLQHGNNVWKEKYDLLILS